MSIGTLMLIGIGLSGIASRLDGPVPVPVIIFSFALAATLQILHYVTG
jgi:hypothetical protein